MIWPKAAIAMGILGDDEKGAMTDPSRDPDIANAIRILREQAMRQVMAMVNRMRPDIEGDYTGASNDGMERAFKRGHLHARMQIYDEIQRMIAADAHGKKFDFDRVLAEYENEGDAAEPVEDD